MKKLSALLLAGVFSFGLSFNSMAQDGQDTTAMADAEADTAAAPVEQEVAEEVAEVAEDDMLAAEDEATFHQRVKEKFIEGGWEFMSVVLICLILGLAIAIERIITLNMATTNTDKLLRKVEDAGSFAFGRNKGWDCL